MYVDQHSVSLKIESEKKAKHKVQSTSNSEAARISGRAGGQSYKRIVASRLFVKLSFPHETIRNGQFVKGAIESMYTHELDELLRNDRSSIFGNKRK